VQAAGAAGERHKVVPVYIDGDGMWLVGKNLDKISTYQNGKRVRGRRVHMRPGEPVLRYKSGRAAHKIDAALLCVHGANGEDGSLQGLLRLCGVPFTGSGILGSAVGMDKIVMKKLFIGAGLPVLPFVDFTADDYARNAAAVTERIGRGLRFPLIVKPANLGSSIGVGIARDFDGLSAAIAAALEWDTRVVVENALEDFCEYNCAVLGGSGSLTVSEVEQPVGWKEFLTFEDKYFDKKGGASRKFPAAVSAALRSKIRAAAALAFKTLLCSGVARVDFLYKDGDLYVNEINTIPGSLSHYLFTLPAAPGLFSTTDTSAESVASNSNAAVTVGTSNGGNAVVVDTSNGGAAVMVSTANGDTAVTVGTSNGDNAVTVGTSNGGNAVAVNTSNGDNAVAVDASNNGNAVAVDTSNGDNAVTVDAANGGAAVTVGTANSDTATVFVADAASGCSAVMSDAGSEKLSFPDLIDRLLEIAVSEHNKRESLRYTFTPNPCAGIKGMQ
jgi:D-alanine-D-alanine ligase